MTVNWSLQHKRDTAANWTANNPTLLEGQLGIETDGLTTTPKFKIGDGVTAWNTLPYASSSASDLTSVLGVGNSTSGQDIVLTTDDLLKFGTTTAAIYNDSNIIDPNHIAIATNTTFTGHTHILLSDGANEWHDESANAFISIMAGAVPNNSVQIDASNDKINIFSGANGLNLQNDTYLNSLTASRLLSLDANKKIGVETGTGFLKLSGGVISYDNSTYLTTSAAALAYQPLDSDLTSWAGVTRASGFDTFVITPNSANLSSLLTDKTGTGVNVFGTSPTFTTDITTPLIIGGSAVGSKISYKGTSGNGTSTATAHEFLVGNNGATTALQMLNDGKVSVGTPTLTNQRIFTVGQDTAYITMGSNPSVTSLPMLWMNQSTPSNVNYTLYGYDAFTQLNCPNNGGSIALGLANTTRLEVKGLVTTGASTSFTFTKPNNTGQTASTAINGVLWTLGSRQWATGAITTQKEFELTSPTYSFVGASTIAEAYSLYVNAPTAGTNATITNKFALGLLTGSTTFKIGQLTGSTTQAAIYINKGTPSSTNYTLRDDNSSNTFINGSQVFTAINGTTVLAVTPQQAYFQSFTAQTSGAWNAYYFSPASNTGQTASTEVVGFLYNSYSRTWAAGAITTQRERYYKTVTYAFASASTITNAYGAYFEAPTAGANATITNNYAAGFNGNVTVLDGYFLNARIKPRVTSITSSATPTINTDNCDAVTITALATAITSMTTNLSGTPNNFDKLTIRIKDDGTARAITWGTSFEAKGVALPTTTVISKVLTVGFIYDSVTAKWGCIASSQEV